MSDPFAPRPLPPRPVYQEADIIERGAAAELRNLDVRYQEFAETGRLKMQRDRAQAKAQYGADVQTARMDYEQRLNNPINNLISSLPEIALGIYQGVRDTKRKEYLVQENGRQAAMIFASRAKVNNGIRTIMSEMQLEDLSFDEVRGMIVELITSETEEMKWSGDAEIDQPNQLQWQNMTYQVTENALNTAVQFETNNSLDQTEANNKLAINQMIQDYRNGDDSKPAELQEWLLTNPRGLENEHLPGSFTQNLLSNAMVDRLSSVGLQTYVDAMKMGADFEDARVSALQVMQEDPLFRELEERESRGELTSEALSVIDKRIVDERAAQTLTDSKGREEFFRASLAGEYSDLSPEQIFSKAVQQGFSPDEANRMGWQQAENAASALQMENSLVAQDKAERTAAHQSSVALALMTDLLTSSALPSATEFTYLVQQLMANGSIEQSAEKLKWWNDQYQSAQTGLLDRYEPERKYIQNIMGRIREGATMVGDTAWLKTFDDRWVSVDQVEAQLLTILTDSITRGIEGEGADGQKEMQRYTSMTPINKGDTPGGMMNHIHRSVRKVLSEYNLRGAVGNLLGYDNLSASLKESTGGKNMIYADPAVVTSRPMVGAEYATARAMVALTGNEEQLNKFDMLPAAAQTNFALTSIPLKTYTPGQTVEEAGEIFGSNMNVLSRYRDEGLIYQAQVDFNNLSMSVQLVPGGSWYPIIRASQSIAERTAEISRAADKVVELVNAGDEGLLAIDGSFVDVNDPSGSGRTVTIPTEYTRTVGDRLEKLSALLAENLPHLWSFIHEYTFNTDDVALKNPGLTGTFLRGVTAGARAYGVQP